MKVLKKAPAWEPKQVTCECTAVLEIEFGDLKRTHYDEMGQREPAWDQIFVTCPECGKTIDIRDVPKHLVERIPDTRVGYSAHYRQEEQ